MMGCETESIQFESEILLYDNIMIYSDLSSRLLKNPNDTIVIDQISEYFVDHSVMPGTKVNDRSSIYFSRINYLRSECPTSKVDIGNFGNLELQKKQQFVNDQIPGSSLSDAMIDFRQAVRCAYDERDSGGLDVLSLINREISSGNHVKEEQLLIGEQDTTIISFRNHLIIFTDGYLEFSRSDGPKGVYLGGRQIKEIRKFCEMNNMNPREALKEIPRFKLTPLLSKYNKIVDLYILETDDRGMNVNKGTLKNTGALSDNNILKTVWGIWSEESGFKSFTWKEKTTPTNLPSDYVYKMIHNNN